MKGTGTLPLIKPNVLENVLNELPEPNEIYVTLGNNFNFSQINDQVNKRIRNVKLKRCNKTCLKVEEPTKSKLIKIHKRVYSNGSYLEARWGEERNIFLEEAVWYLEETRLSIDPHHIEVKYNRKKPNYLAQIKKRIKGTNTFLNIKKA